MKLNFFWLVLALFITTCAKSQTNDYSISLIADSLKVNANAVVRLNQVDITVLSQQRMSIKTVRVITVLNERGLSAIDAIENYNKKTSVITIEASVLDGFGKEIKKIKRKDFKDQSAVGPGTIFSDSRYLYLDYTPIQYPFTIVYNSELETSTTAFIPQWYPFSNFEVSTKESILNVTFPDNLGFKKKECNFDGFNLVKVIDNATHLSYSISNLPAKRQEDYSPNYSALYPRVIMALEKFHLEGVDGEAKTWKEFGQWYSSSILEGTTTVSEETKDKMKLLVGNEKDLLKKARIIYDYVQKKSRYVSIQVGIGGWKPMLASDVDKLGYGDCKGLTNYTKALLAAVDVPSYNVVLYGDTDKINIDSDFVSMQGNHMILAIPIKDDYVWLECTSQVDPFGFQGTFTDDRDVLVIKGDGGEIVHTKVYENKYNSQISVGNYKLNSKGDLEGQITITSKGSQYVQKAAIENWQPEEKEHHYKKYWNTIQNLKINSLFFSNNKETVSFDENAIISAENYSTSSNGKMMFPLNAYNQYTSHVKRIRSRKNPFEINRGFFDSDEITIEIPSGFEIEYLPSDFELHTKFGDYKTTATKAANDAIVYKRTFYIKKGVYASNDYDDYRLFIEQVSKNDNAKTIINKI
jgi:transglutaminase-like putative cysteine protease